jgi:hypothetical protein
MPTLPEIRIPMPEEEQPLTLYGRITNTNEPPKYDDIQNSNLPKEEKIRQIQYRTKAYQDDLDRQLHKDYARIGLGGLVSAVGALPIAITKNPVIGSAIGGGVYELGQGIMEGDEFPELMQRSGWGSAIGGITGGTVSKAAKAINKFNNPWFVDEGLQNGDNVLSYMYDRIIPKNNKRLSKLETPEAIRKIRTAGSGHNDGIGVYTKRSYPNANAGVVATYYPTGNLTKTSKIQGWETPKFNELTPNNNETAQLYYDTLKGVKDKFGKAYDTVSLHPVEEYKNMRLFLSPDKANGFAIQPDGDIVSVFGAKPGSGTSHSMLELALQNKGYKLDNYDVSRLRNLYDNHGFNVTEKMKWNDEFWDPKEWDKSFMQKEYGVAEPDITFREIYDKNIYPEIQSTSLFEKLIDAIK